MAGDLFVPTTWSMVGGNRSVETLLTQRLGRSQKLVVWGGIGPVWATLHDLLALRDGLVGGYSDIHLPLHTPLSSCTFPSGFNARDNVPAGTFFSGLLRRVYGVRTTSSRDSVMGGQVTVLVVYPDQLGPFDLASAASMIGRLNRQRQLIAVLSGTGRPLPKKLRLRGVVTTFCDRRLQNVVFDERVEDALHGIDPQQVVVFAPNWSSAAATAIGALDYFLYEAYRLEGRELSYQEKLSVGRRVTVFEPHQAGVPLGTTVIECLANCLAARDVNVLPPSSVFYQHDLDKVTLKPI